MLSIIIATLNSERALLSSLPALVPGAMDGLVREVIVSDGGSRDDTAIVADAAGCNFLPGEPPLARRLKVAAAGARAPWLLFLSPGTVLESGWTTEVRRFLGRPSAQAQAAVFRREARAGWPELRAALASTLGFAPRLRQGLVIARPFYDALGGHAEHAADPDSDLARRIGRRRLVTLRTRATPTGFDT